MYPVSSSSQSAPRPDERRSASRHTATAIIYVHLGTDNGGIVINLGTGGVAFQAAMRLTAKKDSALSVRLRGSGLDVQLVGEIVWLGASQKEAGICFKDPSTKQQQDIATWIARQTQPLAAVSYGERPWQELPPAIPLEPPGADKFGSHSLAAALGMSQAMPADAVSKINPDADPDDSMVSALLDPDGEVSSIKPRLEIVPPPQESTTSAANSATHLSDLDANSSSSAAAAEPELLLPAKRIAEIAAVKPLEHGPIPDSSDAAPIADTIPDFSTELSSSAVETNRETGPFRPEATQSQSAKFAPGGPALRPMQLSSETSLAERWIPPALLTIWRNGALPHRLLLACAGVAGVGFFGLVLTLAVTRKGVPDGQPVTAPALPQPVAQSPVAVPAVSTVSVDQAPADSVPQSAPVHPAAVPPRAPRSQVSSLAHLANTIFGSPDNSTENTINDDQLRIQVWTSKTNGYYYCTDDPFYKSVQPGEFMSQGDALQSGYRSILGQFCN